MSSVYSLEYTKLFRRCNPTVSKARDCPAVKTNYETQIRYDGKVYRCYSADRPYRGAETFTTRSAYNRSVVPRKPANSENVICRRNHARSSGNLFADYSGPNTFDANNSVLLGRRLYPEIQNSRERLRTRRRRSVVFQRIRLIATTVYVRPPAQRRSTS